MNQPAQSYTAKNSSTDSQSSSKGSLMTGFAFGSAIQMPNTSIKGMQKSGLHPHVQNPQSRAPFQQTMQVKSNTPVLDYKYPRKGDDPCRNEMDKLDFCMQKNGQDIDKCQSQYYSFKSCRQDNNY